MYVSINNLLQINRFVLVVYAPVVRVRFLSSLLAVSETYLLQLQFGVRACVVRFGGFINI